MGKLINNQNKYVQTALLMIYDAIAVNVAFLLALLLRFDMNYTSIDAPYLNGWMKFAPFYTVFCLIVFFILNLYKSIWKYASFTELLRVINATFFTFIFNVAGTLLFIRRMPISYYIVGSILQFLFMITIRFSYRFVTLLRSLRPDNNASRVMIVGAGSAGLMILRDIRNSHTINDEVVCFIDDDNNKRDRIIEGVPVVGGREDITRCVEEFSVDKIYLALPSVSASTKRDILNICSETDCELKQLPGMYQLVSGQISVSHMRDVSVEDLLGREPIKADLKEVFEFINGKTVLVTGGGGSIGSELCRQIAGHDPKKLVIFDIYENNAYDLQQELKKKYPDLNFEVEIGSVRDSRRLCHLFNKYHPDVVYHAAAHKHVPLMEVSPNETIKNNVIGTYKTAYVAMTYHCKRFVLISTDKAVNPTNIMGASKRMCEMIIQSFDKKIKEGKADEIPFLFTHEGEESFDSKQLQESKTEFVAVRFGNVLGSNGSVIPLFKKQIEAGGPVTVTHKDIVRYFMTIPEAVSLVLLAGTYAKGGEIFVLDMGSPVKIDTLARNLIRLAGYKPDVDIKIEYVGLRPGEKLYEEKLMAEEGLERTKNKMIHIGHPIAFNEDEFLVNVNKLMNLSYENHDDIRHYVKDVVNTYKYKEDAAYK